MVAYANSGDRIHVEFDATVRDTLAGGPHATTRVVADATPDGQAGETTHYVYLGDPSVYTVLPPALAEKELPRFWPPVVGDVWFHGPSGQTYVVRENAAYENRVVLTRNNIADPEYYVAAEDEHVCKYLDEAVPNEWERLVGSANE